LNIAACTASFPSAYLLHRLQELDQFWDQNLYIGVVLMHGHAWVPFFGALDLSPPAAEMAPLQKDLLTPKCSKQSMSCGMIPG